MDMSEEEGSCNRNYSISSGSASVGPPYDRIAAACRTLERFMCLACELLLVCVSFTCVGSCVNLSMLMTQILFVSHHGCVQV